MSLIPTAAAHAEVDLSASVVSNYRQRGYSVSDRRPALSLAAVYDHPSGVYLGGSLVGEHSDRAGARFIGHTEYLGYALRGPGGVSWDLGVNNQDLSSYTDRKRYLRYTEVYVGAVRKDLSVRLAYSPNYFRRDVRTLYASVDGALHPADRWRLFAHLGALTPLGSADGQATRRERYDLQAGVARQLGRAEISLAWTATLPKVRPSTPVSRPGLVLGATVFF